MRGFVVMSEREIVEQFRKTFKAPNSEILRIYGLRELTHVFRVLRISPQKMEELLVCRPEVALDDATKARLRGWTFMDGDLVNGCKSFEGFTAEFFPAINHKI